MTRSTDSPRQPVGHHAVSRRTFLQAAGLTAAAFSPFRISFAQQVDESLARSVATYLESCRHGDGYGWSGGTRNHLTATYGAVGAYHVLGQNPPQSEEVAEYVRNNHPFEIKRLERPLKSFEYQQIQTLQWLGADASPIGSTLEKWTEPAQYTRAYERSGEPILQYEVVPVIGRAMLGMPLDDIAPAYGEYLIARRRANGSFNNTPADDGTDGHLWNTWWGLLGVSALGSPGWRREETIDWVRRCQLDSGGFTWQPEPYMAPVSDVAYTWAALRIFDLLGAEVPSPEKVVRHLGEHQNPNGGFGFKPGWQSNPIATWYALDALRMAGDLHQPIAGRSPSRPRMQINDRLKALTIQVEAPGKGSPSEAVGLAESLRIHLWAAKNAEPGWIDAAQSIADGRRVEVTFCRGDEEYGTFVNLPGLGDYSHTSDLVAPADTDIGKSLAGEPDVDWEEFRQRRLRPLEAGEGRLIWQFNENEALTRLYLDDSVHRGGYAAISTFHFGNPNFLNSSPFLQYYRGQIPYVAMQDSHSNEPWWWADQLTGFRTLFFATEPTWEGFLDALKHDRIVSVRHDAVSGGETWFEAGRDEWIDFAKVTAPQWQWWDNPHVSRPPVAITAVRPDSPFELMRPQSGIDLRVRCQWDNTTRGVPKTQRVELLALRINGEPVTAQTRQVEGRAGLADIHHVHSWNPQPGEYEIAADYRRLDTGERGTHQIKVQI